MANKEKLRALIDLPALAPEPLGLEIGPGFDPVLPKREGYRVESLDHLSAGDLRLKYAQAANVDLGAIEEVDHVSDGGSILEVIGQPQRYDFIVASHVIEHTVDLLGFVSDCQQLLKPHGKLVLAVPDMRLSFDCLRPPSTTGQVLQAHADKGHRHAIGKIFDELAHNCLRNGAIAWSRDNQGALAFFRPLQEAGSILAQYEQGDMFIDIHAWQFTPSSFRLIMKDLFDLGRTELREHTFDGSSDNEFMVVLSRQGAGCPMTRLELAEQAVFELRGIHAGQAPVAPSPAAHGAASGAG